MLQYDNNNYNYLLFYANSEISAALKASKRWINI